MSYDLESSVTQSAADKVVRSVSYPFTVFEERKPYEGLAESPAGSDEAVWEFDAAAYDAVVQDAVGQWSGTFTHSRTQPDAESLGGEMLALINSLSTNAAECMSSLDEVERYNQDNPSEPLTWDGPDRAELQEIIDLASEAGLTVANLNKVLGDWGIKAVVTWIKVSLGVAPTFTLAGDSFALSLPKIVVDGTGEVWAKHPWLKCIKKKWGICYKWKKVVKHTRLLRVTLRGLKFKVGARATILTEGALVKARGHFDTLRIDHRYLDRIPLEKLANRKLQDRTVVVFDARELVATIPTLKSKFKVDSIHVPPTPGKVSVEVTVTQA